MSFHVLTKALFDSRRGFLGWGIGLILVTALYTGVYAVVDPASYSDLLDAWPDELIDAFGWEDFTSAAGYLGSTVYGIIIPILSAVFAIGLGARYIAGDEERGTLELIAAHPVSRVSIVVQRAGAAALACLGAAFVVFLVVLLLNAPVGLDLPIGSIVAVNIHLWLLATVFATFALAVGGATGSRAAAIGAATVLAVAAYFGNTIIPSIEGFEWVQNLSVFHYYDGVGALKEGLALGPSLIQVALAVIFTGGAAVLFDRRDIGV